jgi:hypothetical protein
MFEKATEGDLARGCTPSPSAKPPGWTPAPSVTSLTDQPGQSQILITRTGVRGIVSAEHLHADTLDLV